MQNIYFNIRNSIVLQRILQENFMRCFEHMNGRYVCIRSMLFQDDPKFVFGKLVDVNPLHEVLQFHLQADGFRGTQLVTLEPDDVLILFDANQNRTEFVPHFIYWDDKYTPEPGLNLKSLINISRLDKLQLEKYWIHEDYLLMGRKAIVRSMTIHTFGEDVICRFVGIPNYSSKYPIILINYREGDRSSQMHIGRESETKDNDLVLIIFDKTGVNPEFIYWED